MIRAFRAWRRQRAADRIQVSEAQWAATEARLPCLGHLDADDRARLRVMTREFLAEKEWASAGDLRLSPDMQLSIALQACLPVLNLGLDHYRGWVGIVVGCIAMVSDVFTIRRFFAVDHKWRWVFSGVALCVITMLTVLLVQDIVHVLG